MCRSLCVVAPSLLWLTGIVAPTVAAECFDYGAANPVVAMCDPGYMSNAFVLDGYFAYVARQYPPGLSVLDIADPAHPQVVADLPYLEATQFLCRDGDLLYVAGYYHLSIVDVSEPAAPAVLGSLPLEGVCDLGVADGVVCLAAYDRFIVVDATEPAQPVIVGELTFAWNTINKVAVSGPYAYVAVNNAGMYVVDVSNPAAPQWLSRFYDVNFITQVEVQDGRLWVSRYLYYGTLFAFDLGDPAAPQWRGTWNEGAGSFRFAVSGGRAVVCEYSRGVLILDVTEPEAIHETNTVPGLASASGAAFWGDLAVIDVSNQVYAVIDPRVVYAPPAPVFSFDNGDAHVFLQVANGLLYDIYRRPSDSQRGLQIFNIDTAGYPQVVGVSEFPVGLGLGDFEVVGNLAYVPVGSHLRIIDVSNPQVPALLSTTDVPCCVRDVAVQEPWAYVAISGTAVEDGKIVFVDAHVPAAPSVAATLQLPYRVDGVAVMDDIVIAGTEDGRLFTLTNSVPPAILGSIDLDQRLANDIVVSGSIAFAAGNHGIRAVDCRDPAAPVIVDRWYSGDSVQQLAIAHDHLYASTNDQGVAVFDVASGRLELVGLGSPPVDGMHGLAVDDQLLFVASSDIRGFPLQCDGRQLASLTPVTDDADPARLAVTSGTRPLVIRLHLPAAQHGDLAVFDLRGRRVATLATGFLPAGQRTLTWNGRDGTGRVCAAGVYVVRLAGRDGLMSRSVALLH